MSATARAVLAASVIVKSDPGALEALEATQGCSCRAMAPAENGL
jgi:hypothetical protein